MLVLAAQAQERHSPALILAGLKPIVGGARISPIRQLGHAHSKSQVRDPLFVQLLLARGEMRSFGSASARIPGIDLALRIAIAQPSRLCVEQSFLHPGIVGRSDEELIVQSRDHSHLLSSRRRAAIQHRTFRRRVGAVIDRLHILGRQSERGPRQAMIRECTSGR